MAKKERCGCAHCKWSSWIALALVVLEIFYPLSFKYGTFSITTLSLAVLLLASVAACSIKNCSCNVK